MPSTSVQQLLKDVGSRQAGLLTQPRSELTASQGSSAARAPICPGIRESTEVSELLPGQMVQGPEN